MENVHPPSIYSATEPQQFRKYFKEYQAECNLSKVFSDDAFQNRLEILKEDFDLPLNLDDTKDLEDLCTINKLKVSKENPELPLDKEPRKQIISRKHQITPEAKKLCTVQTKEEFNALKDGLFIDVRTYPLSVNERNEDLSLVKDIPPGSTFILNILIFAPFNTLLGNRHTIDHFRLQYEIEVLGTNTLPDLANIIKCVSDEFIIKEVPDMQVDLSTLQKAKEEYPSRCFFIENTFYNDMSHPNAIDYSEVVREWAAEKKIGELKSYSMEGTTFDSLQPRLGYGYVYIHQGRCEHIVCFSDARLVQNSDCLDSKKYPRLISVKRHVNHLCFICSENHASWLVMNSDRLPVRKAFFCTTCCNSYMFLNGKKVGEFQLYPYYAEAYSNANQEEGRVEQGENDWGYVDAS